MYAETMVGLDEDPAAHLETVFDAGHDEMIMVHDVPFSSTCEHHLVPFIGVAHVAYIPGPDGLITGLSKIARLVDGYARRPQVQERLTTQVADALGDELKPAGVLVVLEAEHLCMSIRGVNKPGALTVTSAVRGHFPRQRPRTRRGDGVHHRATRSLIGYPPGGGVATGDRATSILAAAVGVRRGGLARGVAGPPSPGLLRGEHRRAGPAGGDRLGVRRRPRRQPLLVRHRTFGWRCPGGPRRGR